MNLLATREYRAIVYVGPARSSKTYSLLLGGITWVQICSPGDTMVVHMTQDTAKDFSNMELDRVIRNSYELQSRLSPRVRDDSTFRKQFRSGVVLKMAWPSVSQVSGKTIQYMFLTDYDRPENRDNVDGEGPLFDLAMKRTETYMSRGKTLAESSPAEDIIDASWHAGSPHEAPPSAGILALYNRGTRARWYWQCKHCKEPFEAKPGLDMFCLPAFEELEVLVRKTDSMTLADRFAQVPCPSCGGLHKMADRKLLNERGKWLHDGEEIDEHMVITGTRRRSPIASYWQGGVSATYQRWDGLLNKYFQAVLHYARTGDESSMKTTTNMDCAAPYLPRNQARKRRPDELMERVEEWERGSVPPGVKFLVSSIDVQMNAFVIHTIGWGEGFESWLIERTRITSSNRPEGTRFAALDPAGYLEDWDVILEEVIKKKYPVSYLPGVYMGPHVTACDSGGREGVTMRAYDFWRKMRAVRMAPKFILVKGDNRPTMPRVQETWPDTRQKRERGAGGRGDVPVWMLNVNLLKDGVVADLNRDIPGAGYIHLPKWAVEEEKEYFSEMTSETKNAKGIYERQGNARNEGFDLHVYSRAACIILRAEKIDWQNPPEWARGPRPLSETAPKEKTQSIANLGRSLNG